MIEGGITVKKLSVLGIIFGIILGSFLGVTICVGFSATAAFARGGIGSHPSSIGAGGASGERVNAPGTNSLGTALSSSGHGNGAQKGPLLGTNPAIDQEEAKVTKMMSSICRGC
jgi:hypothetical protein